MRDFLLKLEDIYAADFIGCYTNYFTDAILFNVDHHQYNFSS